LRLDGSLTLGNHGLSGLCTLAELCDLGLEFVEFGRFRRRLRSRLFRWGWLAWC